MAGWLVGDNRLIQVTSILAGAGLSLGLGSARLGSDIGICHHFITTGLSIVSEYA